MDFSESFGKITNGVLGLVVLAMAVVIGIVIFSSLQTQQVTATTNCGLNSTGGTGAGVNYAACGYAYNATATTNGALAGVPGFYSILIIVVVAIAILAGVLYLRGNRG
jgi:cobalamin biosynthesis Mg chelatase CobN